MRTRSALLQCTDCFTSNKVLTSKTTVNVVILFEKTDIRIQAAREETPVFSSHGQFQLDTDQSKSSSETNTQGILISALQDTMCR